MERSPVCPSCLSKYADIRGMLYPCGSYVGYQCEDIWHRGAEYDPNTLFLNDADIAMLKDWGIGV